jgi:hypothetical protein
VPAVIPEIEFFQAGRRFSAWHATCV